MQDVLAKLKKHHFWILVFVVVVVAVYSWYSATANLADEFDGNVRQIKNTYAKLMRYQTEDTPNADYAKSVQNVQTRLHGQVLDAWTLLAETQANEMAWPEPVKEIALLGPHEEIPEITRAFYNNNVVDAEWRKLFDTLNLRRALEAVQPAAGDDDNNKTVKMEGIVVWDVGQRDKIRQRYHTNRTPTTLWVRLTQEDLWVFRSLAKVIIELNRNSTDPLNAVVKRIDYLDVAQYAMGDAIDDPGVIWVPEEGEAETKTGLQLRQGSGRVFTVDKDARDADQAMLEGRYLDQNNHPVAAKSLPPFVPPGESQAPFAEFKQVFVQMKFLMDQRKIPALLAECANSPLPVETRQVRINLAGVDTPFERKQGSAVIRERGDDLNRVELGPYDAEVTVRGIVYIYNKPDEKQLGKGAADEPAQRAFGIPVEIVEENKFAF